MVGLTDYADLRRAVIEHVGKTSIADVLNRLTLTAEDMLNRKLRHRKQITAQTLTFTDGEASLPDDYLEMLHVYDTSGNDMFENSLSLQRASGSQYRFYAIDGSTIKIFGLSGDRDIVYYAKLPTVTSSATGTNWLLSAYPNVYTYAVGWEAAKYLRDTELAAVTRALLEQELSEAKIDSDRARFGHSVVRVAGVTP